MSKRVLVLGAGFGGLELSSTLSERLGERAEVTLIDRADAFTFGFAKLDVMFGHADAEQVKLPYERVLKPGVRLLEETVTAIDPQARRVTTDRGTHEGDALVIALGAGYDFDATPGLAEHGDEFYSVPGAERLAPKIAGFQGGDVVIGVCGAPFKCPPAPSECALLMHDHLVAHGLRERSTITFAIPLGRPVPPSPETSDALEAAFAERDIRLLTGRRLASVTADGALAVLDDGTELPCDLLMAVPKHRAAQVLIDSGMTEDGYVPVDFSSLRTRHEGVYALGDVATAGVPKAGVFAEGAAKVVAEALIAELEGGEAPRHLGRGTCYIEFGAGRIGSVDIDFLSGPEKTGVFNPPSEQQRKLKEQFGATRRARWFGL